MLVINTDINIAQPDGSYISGIYFSLLRINSETENMRNKINKLYPDTKYTKYRHKLYKRKQNKVNHQKSVNNN